MITIESVILENIILKNAITALNDVIHGCGYDKGSFSETMNMLRNHITKNELSIGNEEQKNRLAEIIDIKAFEKYSTRISTVFLELGITHYYDLLKIMLLCPDKLLKMRFVGIHCLVEIAVHLKESGLIDDFTVVKNKLRISSSLYARYIK
jgi:hypothetical protein